MIVVTGATGNVGRVVVAALAAAGEQVTAVSRRGAQGAGGMPLDTPPGVRHVQADLADPAALEAAFAGADALFLLVAGDDPAGILAAAKAAGVRRVVLLTSQGTGTRPNGYRHPRAFEEAVRASGLEWTILRPTGFATNAYQWAEAVRTTRTAAAPFADVALPVVHPADIGEVAAEVLVKPGHASATYVLTGPAAVSPREQVAAIEAAVGEPVAFVELTREQARAMLLNVMPEQVADDTLEILGTPTDDERRVSPSVEAILGRAPRSFARWAEENAPAFK
ncbi:SDR family oxidoreductase [Yinghuangia seranimata]|uniref:SDR family oxidoreductase n=1 Tax=Yinghuangia seranimata TaxID=408067 RepID=UPI00248C024D|nr:NAD(P)H-binding protein [Yinghuangia seranimata]MDI2125751.1 NAD(P)H-binding protein [Yinghuangia seranimata]